MTNKIIFTRSDTIRRKINRSHIYSEERGKDSSWWLSVTVPSRKGKFYGGFFFSFLTSFFRPNTGMRRSLQLKGNEYWIRLLLRRCSASRFSLLLRLVPLDLYIPRIYRTEKKFSSRTVDILVNKIETPGLLLKSIWILKYVLKLGNL